MAEPISSSPLSGAASFRNEWSALVECASPAHDRQRLAELLRSADWARLLVLAEDHGVGGHLTASLRGLEEPFVPLEIKQSLADRPRAQVFFSLRVEAQVVRVIDRFPSERLGGL